MVVIIAILLIIIGLEYLSKSHIAVIEGNYDLDANTQENLDFNPAKLKLTTKDLEYPKGFNKENCIVIAVGLKFYNDDSHGYSYGDTGTSGHSSEGMITGAVCRNVQLKDTISLKVGNMSTSSRTCYYKIVIMRI